MKNKSLEIGKLYELRGSINNERGTLIEIKTNVPLSLANDCSTHYIFKKEKMISKKDGSKFAIRANSPSLDFLMEIK